MGQLNVKRWVLLALAVIIVAASIPASADVFIRRNASEAEETDEKKPRRLFLMPKIRESKVFKRKKPEQNKTMTRQDMMQALLSIPGVPKIDIPRNFDSAMLSPSGPVPKTEQDLITVANIKKQAQLIDLYKRRLARQKNLLESEARR